MAIDHGPSGAEEPTVMMVVCDGRPEPRAEARGDRPRPLRGRGANGYDGRVRRPLGTKG